MAHHKKRKNKNALGHCKMCKPWKIQGISREEEIFEKHSDHKRRIFAKKEAMTWDEAMEKVLEEHKDVWQALADYDKEGK